MSVVDMQIRGDERISGVELLALYGDGDERIGKVDFRRGLKSLKKGAMKAAKFTPQYWAAKGVQKGYKGIRKKMRGDEMELLGAVKKKKFLPGLSKVGKITSKFTSAAAGAFIPKSTLDLIAKADPTKKRKAVAIKAVVPVTKEAMKIDTKKIAIIGGAALGALVILKIVTAPRQAVRY